MRVKKRQTITLVLFFFGLLILNHYWSWVHGFFLVRFFHYRYDYYFTLQRLRLVSPFSKGPIVQIVTSDTADVVWEMRYDPAIHYPEETTRADLLVEVWWRVEEAEYTTVARMYQDVHLHFVYRARIDGLSGLPFEYTIKIGTFESRRFRCAYTPKTAETTRIAVLGDNQFAAVMFSRVLAQLSQRGEVQYVLHLGDVVQVSSSPKAWSTDFVDPMSHYGLLTKPWMMLHGNHDYPSIYGSLYDDISWTSYTIGSVFFIVLDSNVDSQLQDAFVRRALSSPEAKGASKRIALVHIPPFVEFWDPEPWLDEKSWGEFVRFRFVGLFEQYSVDLVLSGHQHNYQRGTHHGVVYVTAGGAGGTLDGERVEDYGFFEKTIVEHHFGILELAGETVRWNMYTVDGVLKDSMLL